MRALLLSLMLIAASPAPVVAQCQLCATPARGTPTVAPPKPLDIQVEASLDFSRIALGGGQGGHVVVDPSTGARHVDGGLTDLGGGVLRGQVRVVGEPMRPIRVMLPNRITLTASDGSTVDVNNIRTNLSGLPNLGSDGVLVFEFGGQLNVGAANAGNYHGRIPITVEYQ